MRCRRIRSRARHGGGCLRRGGLRRCSWRGCSLAFEALAAKDRTPLSGLERYCCSHAALGTLSARLCARNTCGCRTVARRSGLGAMRAAGFAGLAALGVVLKLLVLEKKLLTCGKDKIASAVNAGQYPVSEFHCRFSLPYESPSSSRHGLELAHPVNSAAMQHVMRTAMPWGRSGTSGFTGKLIGKTLLRFTGAGGTEGEWSRWRFCFEEGRLSDALRRPLPG